MKIRRSTFDHRPPGYTPLENETARTSFMFRLPISAGSSPQADVSTPTELFLQDPSLGPAILSFKGVRYAELYKLSADIFSERLSLLFNTYWQCSLA